MEDEIRAFGENSVMDTIILREITDESLSKMGEVIRDGGLVAFPTETVYGLGANAYDDVAVKNIYVAKGRPSDNPLIVHIADISDIDKVAREVPENAKKLIEAFAPGPFTMILKKQPNISDTVTAGLDTVGVRIPSDKIARAFLKAANVPVAAPSANLSGKPSPTSAEHVIDDMNGRIDAIICGNESEVGVESTIIDLTGDVPTILRPGGITLEDVISVCGAAKLDEHILTSVKESEQPKCPGMKYKHYSPDADVTVVEGEASLTFDKIKSLVNDAKENGKNVGVLAKEDSGFSADFFISTGEDNITFSNVLFSALRRFDKEGMDIVFVQFSNDDSKGLAVKNRLYKAAGNKVIYVGE